MKKKYIIFGFVFLCIAHTFIIAQDPMSSGIEAYARSDWSTAILSFRKAITLDSSGAEPWYWLIMSEISAEQYDNAVQDISRYIARFPDEQRVPDLVYQQGRIYYLLESYESCVKQMHTFIESWPNNSLVSSAYYWIGECFYTVGRFEESKKVFQTINLAYPQSPKREASIYRISLIEQKFQQEELLKLLKLSHEELLSSIEEFQRKEKSYEQAILAYQKRISDMIKDSRLGELEKQLGDEKIRNSELIDKVSLLEIKNAELAALLSLSGIPIPEDSLELTTTNDLNSNDEAVRRKAIEALKQKADSIRKMYDQLEAGGK